MMRDMGQLADYLGLLNPETITGLLVLHSERYGHWENSTYLPDEQQDCSNIYRSLYHTHIPTNE